MKRQKDSNPLEFSESKLKNLLISSVGWLALKRLLTQLVLSLSNLILVRLLFPKDFGSFAIVLFLVNIFWVFTDLGLGKALIQRKKEPEVILLRTIWWTQVGLAILVAGLIYLISPLFAKYYSGALSSEAVFWLRWLAFSQAIANISLVSWNLLERSLNFKRILISDVSMILMTQVVTIILALQGFSVKSFIYGFFIGKIFGVFITFILAPWPWGFGWRWEKLKMLLSFGVPFQISTWMGIVNTAVIPLFLGRFPGPGGWSGPAAVGFVTWALGVGSFVGTFALIVDQIIFPLMSKVQSNKESRSKVFSWALRVVAIVTFIAVAILIALAPETIKIIYTDKWLPATSALRFSLIQILLIATTTLAMSSLLAFGEAKFFRNMNLLWAILQWAFSIPLILIFGFTGVNLAGILVSLTAIWALFYIKKYINISYFKILKFPFFASLLSAIVVYILARLILIDNILELLAVSLLGGLLYLSLLFLLMKERVIADFRIIFKLLNIILGKFKPI
ncbi:oligosaccharide flippase family protein [Candidatus Daviesbacteria bacterium]|nr:oligosaccharide flippase family protein [Candidatus Daviesbacteria bacterium]